MGRPGHSTCRRRLLASEGLFALCHDRHDIDGAYLAFFFARRKGGFSGRPPGDGRAPFALQLGARVDHGGLFPFVSCGPRGPCRCDRVDPRIVRSRSARRPRPYWCLPQRGFFPNVFPLSRARRARCRADLAKMAVLDGLTAMRRPHGACFLSGFGVAAPGLPDSPAADGRRRPGSRGILASSSISPQKKKSLRPFASARARRSRPTVPRRAGRRPPRPGRCQSPTSRCPLGADHPLPLSSFRPSRASEPCVPIRRTRQTAKWSPEVSRWSDDPNGPRDSDAGCRLLRRIPGARLRPA